VEHAVQSARDGTAQNIGDNSPTTPPPPPAVRRWVTYLLAFGVSVGVGLAPLLGTQKVPLFSPLLDLVPDSLRDKLVPFASALMGLLAVVVQWFSEEELDRSARRKAFKWSVAIAFAGAVAFYSVSIFVVRHVDGATVLIGFYPPKERCIGMSAAQCIHSETTVNQDRITSYWGDGNVGLAELALSYSYLIFTLGFASAVGVVIHQKGGISAKADH
jgi:hypothetical protein